MTKAVQMINRYRADLREFSFLLFEQFRLDDVLGKEPFASWGAEEVRSTLTECYRFVREVLGPLNALGDAQGCTVEGGQVKTPDGFKDAWKKTYEAGWKMLAVSPEHGGAGAPSSLRVLVEELLSGSNVAFSMYPGLTLGAAETIVAFGTSEQKALYCPGLHEGRWGGTMCLTEAQAGTDVGAVRCSATRNTDGTYSIRGTKIFISVGDHDLTENVVHLVLARVDGAPAGTKGLTLFIVPKIWIGPDGSLGAPNDVKTSAIEHKMGLAGSATCVLDFGDEGKCLGVPLGGEAKLHQGMSQMFLLMNAARIEVGIQGLGVASAAYLAALEYARDRKQGASLARFKDPGAPRVSIIEHADVRRMLLDMKARVEGIRALILKLAMHQDCARALAAENPKLAQYHQGQIDLLVPLVKAYGSDQAFRICEEAIQTFGGAGYTRDYPVEQYCRDAKVFSIYEGTNHIQAMDLVGRKLGQAGGANLQAFIGDIAKFAAANSGHPTLGAEVKRLAKAQEAVAGGAMRMMAWFQMGKPEFVPLNANRFLLMMSELTVGWLLLQGAVVADAAAKQVDPQHPDSAFYAGKVHAAVYYARTCLPEVEAAGKAMGDEDRTPLTIPDAAFATV